MFFTRQRQKKIQKTVRQKRRCLQRPIFTSCDFEPPADTCYIRIVPSQFRVVHQSRTDCGTEQLSDDLGRMTKLFRPKKTETGRERNGEREQENMNKRKRRTNRELQKNMAGYHWTQVSIVVVLFRYFTLKGV